MVNNKIRKLFSILFLIVGSIIVLEYMFVKGMFTAPLLIIMIGILGIINIIFEIVDKKYIYALNYLLMSIALCMGYIDLMF